MAQLGESLQRFIVRRARSGQHPMNAQEVIDRLEQTVAHRNDAPAPLSVELQATTLKVLAVQESPQ